jgi:hypothetical protein
LCYLLCIVTVIINFWVIFQIHLLSFQNKKDQKIIIARKLAFWQKQAEKISNVELQFWMELGA